MTGDRHHWSTTWLGTPTRRATFLAVVALYLAFGFLHRPNFWKNHDESRRVEAAREVYERPETSWLIPTLNGRDFITKPPVFYWLVATSFRATGIVNEATARVPSALFGLLGALSVWWLARAWRDPETGLLAAGILLTAYLYTQYMRYAEIDMTFVGLIALSFSLLVRGVDAEPRLQLRWFAGFWVVSALAFMVKGPFAPGFALAGAAVAVCLPIERGRRKWFLRLMTNPGILFFVVICLPWYAYIWEHAADAIDVLREETIDRFGTTNVRRRPVWYYILHLEIFAPWLLFLPQALWWAANRRDRVGRLLLCIFLAGIGIATCLSSKKQAYILPLLPAAAVLTAAYLRELERSFLPDDAAQFPAWQRVWATWILRLLTVGGAVAGLGVVVYLTLARMGAVPVDPASVADIAIAAVATGLMAVLALAAWHLTATRRVVRAGLAGAILAALLLALTFHQVLPTLDTQQGVKAFAQRIPDHLPPDATVYTWRNDNFSLSVYARKIVKDIDSIDELPWDPVVYVVVRRRDLAELESIGAVDTLLAYADLAAPQTLSYKRDLILVRIRRPQSTAADGAAIYHWPTAPDSP